MIQIAAITLASDSVITITRFRPAKPSYCPIILLMYGDDHDRGNMSQSITTAIKFCLRSCREILWEIWLEFCGIFSDPQNKGSTFSGKISEHFCGKFRNSKKYFVQTSFCRHATPKQRHGRFCDHARRKCHHNSLDLQCTNGVMQSHASWKGVLSYHQTQSHH